MSARPYLFMILLWPASQGMIWTYSPTERVSQESSLLVCACLQTVRCILLDVVVIVLRVEFMFLTCFWSRCLGCSSLMFLQIETVTWGKQWLSCRVRRTSLWPGICSSFTVVPVKVGNVDIMLYDIMFSVACHIHDVRHKVQFWVLRLHNYKAWVDVLLQTADLIRTAGPFYSISLLHDWVYVLCSVVINWFWGPWWFWKSVSVLPYIGWEHVAGCT